MAVGNFRKCSAVTEKWEGGFSDHPADPGGRTMFGITHAVYAAWRKKHGFPQRPVQYCTIDEARKIYEENYWRPVNGETLAAGVDLATYDAAVNSGVSRAKKWLLASVGERDDITVQRLCAKRLSFVQGLKTWKTFGRGWSRRIADIEAKGVAWALEGKVRPTSAKTILKNNGEQAQKKAVQQGGGAVVTGTGSSAGVVENADQLAGWAMGGILLAVGALVAFLIVRSVVNKHRAEAYAKEAAR